MIFKLFYLENNRNYQFVFILKGSCCFISHFGIFILWLFVLFVINTILRLMMLNFK